MSNYNFDYEEKINYPDLDGTYLDNFDRWMDELRASAEADAVRMEEMGYSGDDEYAIGGCGHAEYDGACSARTCGRAMTDSAFRARLAEIADEHDPVNKWHDGAEENDNPWHECVEENRLLTVEEYTTLPPTIAEYFVNRWVSEQDDKETAYRMATELRELSAKKKA